MFQILQMNCPASIFLELLIFCSFVYIERHYCANCNNLHLKFSLFSCLSLYLFLHALLLLHLWWQDFRKQVNCEVDQRFHVSKGRQREWGQMALWFDLLNQCQCVWLITVQTCPTVEVHITHPGTRLQHLFLKYCRRFTGGRLMTSKDSVIFLHESYPAVTAYKLLLLDFKRMLI